MYICGRDNRFRPVVVVNVQKIVQLDLSIDALTNLIIYTAEHIIHNVFVPGKIENWVLVVDLANIGIFALPLSKLKQLLSILGNNYRAKMFRFYVVNAPWSVSVLYTFLATLDKKTQKKVLLSKDSHMPEMFKHISRAQLEAKYGGTRGDIVEYWPFKDDSDDVEGGGG